MKYFILYLLVNWVFVELWNRYFYKCDSLFVTEFLSDIKEGGITFHSGVGYFLIFTMGAFLGFVDWLQEKIFNGGV